MTDKITIERETLLPCPFCGNDKNIDIANEKHDNSGGYFIACPVCHASTGLRYALGDDPRPLLVEQWNRRAALAAQPAKPVAWMDDFGNAFPLGAIKGAGSWRDEHQRNWRPLYTAPPAPAAVPPDGMDTVAIKYAHKMALDLECILAEYGGSWYNTAMQTLGEYRSEMNAIHERECPTFMGEPVLAAAGDKP